MSIRIKLPLALVYRPQLPILTKRKKELRATPVSLRNQWEVHKEERDSTDSEEWEAPPKLIKKGRVLRPIAECISPLSSSGYSEESEESDWSSDFISRKTEFIGKKRMKIIPSKNYKTEPSSQKSKSLFKTAKKMQKKSFDGSFASQSFKKKRLVRPNGRQRNALSQLEISLKPKRLHRNTSDLYNTRQRKSERSVAPINILSDDDTDLSQRAQSSVSFIRNHSREENWKTDPEAKSLCTYGSFGTFGPSMNIEGTRPGTKIYKPKNIHQRGNKSNQSKKGRGVSENIVVNDINKTISFEKRSIGRESTSKNIKRKSPEKILTPFEMIGPPKGVFGMTTTHRPKTKKPKHCLGTDISDMLPAHDPFVDLMPAYDVFGNVLPQRDPFAEESSSDKRKKDKETPKNVQDIDAFFSDFLEFRPDGSTPGRLPRQATQELEDDIDDAHSDELMPVKSKKSRKRITILGEDEREEKNMDLERVMHDEFFDNIHSWPDELEEEIRKIEKQVKTIEGGKILIEKEGDHRKEQVPSANEEKRHKEDKGRTTSSQNVPAISQRNAESRPISSQNCLINSQKNLMNSQNTRVLSQNHSGGQGGSQKKVNGYQNHQNSQPIIIEKLKNSRISLDPLSSQEIREMKEMESGPLKDSFFDSPPLLIGSSKGSNKEPQAKTFMEITQEQKRKQLQLQSHSSASDIINIIEENKRFEPRNSQAGAKNSKSTPIVIPEAPLSLERDTPTPWKRREEAEIIQVSPPIDEYSFSKKNHSEEIFVIDNSVRSNPKPQGQVNSSRFQDTISLFEDQHSEKPYQFHQKHRKVMEQPVINLCSEPKEKELLRVSSIGSLSQKNQRNIQNNSVEIRSNELPSDISYMTLINLKKNFPRGQVTDLDASASQNSQPNVLLEYDSRSRSPSKSEVQIPINSYSRPEEPSPNDGGFIVPESQPAFEMSLDEKAELLFKEESKRKFLQADLRQAKSFMLEEALGIYTHVFNASKAYILDTLEECHGSMAALRKRLVMVLLNDFGVNSPK